MATRILTLDDVARFLHVHVSTVYRMVKKHSIPGFKIGSDWRFNQASIERWIKEREAERPVEWPATGKPSTPPLHRAQGTTAP
jgi:excisionase family DNA binding protein